MSIEREVYFKIKATILKRDSAKHLADVLGKSEEEVRAALKVIEGHGYIRKIVTPQTRWTESKGYVIYNYVQWEIIK